MANPNLQADSADRNDARAELLNFRINDTTPTLSHQDALEERLEEAHALALLMSCAFEDAATVGRQDGNRIPITHLSEKLISTALHGVASLVAYARFHSDQAGRA